MRKDRTVACEKCFADRKLIAFVQEGGQMGDCPWCRSGNVATISLVDLGDAFREVARTYEPVDGLGGDGIGFLLQQDWNVFSDLIEADTDTRDELAVAILEAGLHPKHDIDEPDYRGGFRTGSESLVEDWYARIERVLTGGAAGQLELTDLDGFPDRLVIAVEDMIVDLPEGSQFVRARLHKPRGRREWLSPSEMGPPPADVTPSQRANRKGEPVLYLASDENTAVAEIRGWRGAVIAVAPVTTTRQLAVVDLTVSVLEGGPFFDEMIAWRIEMSSLLARVAEELSRPLIPDEQERLYLVSQYFADIVRSAGWDGIKYPSAMGNGYHLVLYNAGAVVASAPRYVRVRGISFELEHLSEGEWPYEQILYDA